jgi:hypothetical protein
LRTTEGIVAALANTSSKDASILALLRSLGAVPFVRTTEPQGVVSFVSFFSFLLVGGIKSIMLCALGYFIYLLSGWLFIDDSFLDDA